MDIFTEIDLEFTPENVEKVLLWGLTPETAPHKHQAIAGWCERFWNEYSDVDAPAEIEALMPILSDIETQWDLQIANDENNREMPKEWFKSWLSKLKS